MEEALRGIPRRFRDAMTNVAVVVEDEPSQELLDELDMEPGDTLFGLYHGTPLTERESSYGNTLPDRISIYQLPIEEACEDEEDIRQCVAETVIHEFGHYFGLSEEEIEEIEEKYWRDRSDHAARPSSAIARSMTSCALHPFARKSRTPVSPSDLLSFCVARLHQQRMMKKRRRLSPAEQAGELNLTAGRIEQVLTANDEIHALQPVIDDDGKLIRPVAVPIADEQISTLL